MTCVLQKAHRERRRSPLFAEANVSIAVHTLQASPSSFYVWKAINEDSRTDKDFFKLKE
jgi:hypothetical protein